MPTHPDERWAFSAAQIPEDLFEELRQANLARWPTGGEFDLDEAAAYQRALDSQLRSLSGKVSPPSANRNRRLFLHPYPFRN